MKMSGCYYLPREKIVVGVTRACDACQLCGRVCPLETQVLDEKFAQTNSPVLIKSRSIKTTVIPPDSCHKKNLNKPFSYSAFNDRRDPPLSIGFVPDRSSFEQDGLPSIQDMVIKLSKQKQYILPAQLAQLQSVIQLIVDFWVANNPLHDDYNCYLTASQGSVPNGCYQRRAGIHCDGFQSSSITPKQPGDYIFLVSNILPTEYFVQRFNTENLNPDTDNFFQFFSQNLTADRLHCQKPWEICMLDPYVLHESPQNNLGKSVNRTFLKIVFSQRIYDRAGNTINPHIEYPWNLKPYRKSLCLK
eukprot:TRINITY_DN9073_c0_g1_i1.p1 TRINITY_DN9073_c0_g1~~TRINITY_DN9073_c0_g1_i1.p1  ORF type:complete len:303 (-),score=17.20 TRINITY_DN9073_c0_g1_i1:433-1341(-)